MNLEEKFFWKNINNNALTKSNFNLYNTDDKEAQ